MSVEELRDAIRALMSSHPGITPSPTGHTIHLERFLTTSGKPIGFEPDRVEHQNIWVTEDSVRLHVLHDLKSKLHSKADFSSGKPNHHLFTEDAFRDHDLVCFKVTSLWQAVRVILEVAGTGAKP